MNVEIKTLWKMEKTSGRYILHTRHRHVPDFGHFINF